MPHYVDGTPAKHGDLVIKYEKNSTPSLEVAGIVAMIQPGSESCNLQLLALAVRQKDSDAAWLAVGVSGQLWYATAKDCRRVVELPVPA
jgi:hypothetical protein